MEPRVVLSGLANVGDDSWSIDPIGFFKRDDTDGVDGAGEHLVAFDGGLSAPLVPGPPHVVDEGAFSDSVQETGAATILKTIQIDAGWLAARGEGPYVLGRAQTRYVLQTDVRVDGTAFVVGAEDVVLDLNGHTVTYGDAARPRVKNMGFGKGASATDVPGWNVSKVSDVQRMSARRGMWGAWMLRIRDVSETTRISSDPVAIPEANREYTAAITPKAPANAKVRLIVRDSVTGEVLGSTTENQINRGFSPVVSFTPTTTNPVELHVKLIPPSGGAATFDLDRAVVLPSRDYGVVATPSTWALPSQLKTSEIVSAAAKAERFTLQNGTMVQGRGMGYGSSMVFAQSHKGLTIDRVDAFVNGMDTNHVEAPWARNVTVTDSIFRAEVKRISNRMELFGAIKLISTNGKTRIDGNTILDAPQSGIVISGGKDVQITNNEIRQKAIVANGYAVNLSGSNFTIAGNTIIPVQGRGIMLDTAIGDSSNGVIANNYVKVFEVPNLEYGPGSLEATALRIRAYGSGSIRDVHIHDNTFVARTAKGGVHGALGMRITLFNNGQLDGSNIVIQNNHFKGIVETTDSKFSARAVSISNVYAGTGLRISRNLLESNDTSLGFGDSDSYGGRVEDILLVGNTIKKSTQGASRWHKGVSVGEMKNTVKNVRLIDTRFTNGAAEKLHFFGARTKHVATGWLLGVAVTDGDGSPVRGAQVRVFDKNDNLVFYGTTNAAGRINNIRVITTVYRQTGSDPSEIVEKSRGPHRVKVVSAGFATSMKTILLDQSSDLKFKLTPG